MITSNESTNQDKVRIIIIDDDKLTILLSTKILLNYNSTLIVDSFSSGNEAIEYVRNNELTTSTILLLDIDMPLYTGWDFLNDYSILTSKSKIFMFSSSIDVRDVEKSKQYVKVKGFISKPLNSEKIERFLKDAFL